ncbi:MAG: 16S rRNA (adenine(1518)-N(6)/adenine(1519)-N(6))-dimethyltransferase RsmA [Lachnospiraceae bacterium]|jgi:16S rRNA (adenine1518-N6/adenine1519-N6)-dimethyltransferase|nr:16S rRNA (adenine(1518)-N(6)/adenine(1519)-N(6))-dimethyltransferase RsmA [Lachnospiraceae bacterium]
MDSGLTPYQKTMQIVQKYDFIFRKRFGQNFLVDAHVLDKIVAAADVGPEDVVLEIGPGIGTLTVALAARAGHVVAVEIDRSLLPILAETLEGYSNVTVIGQDIMETDIDEIAKTYGGGRPIKVVANLPYYIATPIVMGLLEKDAPISQIVVMVQKEVASRMQAVPGTKDYGALSLAVLYHAQAYLAANVPPNCFIPRPRVSSAVLRLTPRGKPSVDVGDPAFMFALIRAAFATRRKTLANSLGHDPALEALGITKESAAEAIAGLGFPPAVRGEALGLEEFARLSDALGGSRG